MDSAVTFIILLGCWSVGSVSLSGLSGSYKMVFSGGTQLLVNTEDETAQCDEDDDPRHQNKTTDESNKSKTRSHEGSYAAPSIQIFSSVPLSQDPGSPYLLVCLLTGLNSPVQDILWWVDDTVVTSPGAAVSLMRSEEGGAYSATSVWEVSAADWRSRSTYWCGTIQERRVYRQRLCSQV